MLFISISFAVIIVLCTMRFILTLLLASEKAPFTILVNRLSSPFLRPFKEILPKVTAMGYLKIDLSVLFAIFCYFLFEWLLLNIIELFFSFAG